MKDYEHVVVWLDYFNSILPKSKGRKLAKDRCVSDPYLKELHEAITATGIEIIESKDTARHPKRPYVKSGYIVVPKSASKLKILYKVSQKLVEKRRKKKN